MYADASRGSEPLILRPRITRAYVFAMWVMGFSFIGVVASGTTTGRPQPGVIIAMGAVGAVWGFVCACRIRFTIGDAGIVVRNPLRTYEFDFQDITAVGIKYWGRSFFGLYSTGDKRPVLTWGGGTPPGLGFRLRSGKRVPVAVGTVDLPVEARKALIAALERHLEPLGIPVPVEYPDLKAW